jgi:hypothetical protein
MQRYVLAEAKRIKTVAQSQHALYAVVIGSPHPLQGEGGPENMVMTPDEVRQYISEHREELAQQGFGDAPREVREYILEATADRQAREAVDQIRAGLATLGGLDLAAAPAVQLPRYPKRSGRPVRRRRAVLSAWLAQFLAPVPLLVRAVMALAMAGALALAGLWLTGAFVPPAYAQPWCAAVEAAMHPAGTETFGAFMTRLQAAGAAGAPISALVADEQTASQDNAVAQNDLASNAIGDLAVTMGALQTVRSDMQAVNRECGVPATYRIDSIAVP